jgi:hypothetical protein
MAYPDEQKNGARYKNLEYLPGSGADSFAFWTGKPNEFSLSNPAG